MAGLLSIVIPVFNEAESLEPLHVEIEQALAGQGPFEVVYVDDGSTDASVAVMQRIAAAHENVRVVKLRRNFGKATALTQGFDESRGDVIVTMDGDRQDDPSEIPRLVARLDDGFDLVSGWKQRRQDPITKTLPSRFFNWTVRRTTGLGLHDFNCGLKAYRRDVVDSINVYGELHRYIPVLANDAGFKVAEEKVTHRRRMAGYSKYGWRRYMRGYLDLMTVLFLGRYRYRPQHLFGALGTTMLLVGLAIDLYLTIDKFFGHAIGNRPLFTLANLLIVVGVQIFTVGLVSELVTFGRAREGADTFEVERVLDGATARALLGPEATRAALEAAAAVEFGDAPLPEEAEARERREAGRRAREAAREAREVDEPRAADAARDAGRDLRREVEPGPMVIPIPVAAELRPPPAAPPEPVAERPAERPRSSIEEEYPEELVRRARMKAEKMAAEAERTMGGELRADELRRADERRRAAERPGDERREGERDPQHDA